MARTQAELPAGARKCCFGGLLPAKITRDHDVYALDSPCFELGKDLPPGMGAFPLCSHEEEAQNLPFPLVIGAQGDVDGLLLSGSRGAGRGSRRLSPPRSRPP